PPIAASNRPRTRQRTPPKRANSPAGGRDRGLYLLPFGRHGLVYWRCAPQLRAPAEPDTRRLRSRNVRTPRRPLGGGAAPSLGCAMNSLALSLATFACSLSLALPPGWCCMLAPSRVQAGADQVVQQAEESAPTARRSCCH